MQQNFLILLEMQTLEASFLPANDDDDGDNDGVYVSNKTF